MSTDCCSSGDLGDGVIWVIAAITLDRVGCTLADLAIIMAAVSEAAALEEDAPTAAAVSEAENNERRKGICSPGQ